MKICGMKVNHDGGVALINGNRLEYAVELEKVRNNRRHSEFENVHSLADILDRSATPVETIDRFVVDGWIADDEGKGSVSGATMDDTFVVPVGPYDDRYSRHPMERYRFGAHSITLGAEYSSYSHVAGHIGSSYCTSTYARDGQPATVLIWDGGMVARLYYVQPQGQGVSYVGTPLNIPGHAFAHFCGLVEPFKSEQDVRSLRGTERLRWENSVAGRAMAYAALGTDRPEYYDTFSRLLRGVVAQNVESTEIRVPNLDAFSAIFTTERGELFGDMTDADLIRTYQSYLGNELLDGMKRLTSKLGDSNPGRLCVGGGCALNIKWNSLLRNTFPLIWVPPFPNDSGAAIGAACCEMWHQTGKPALEWDVYSGPSLGAAATLPDGWSAEQCDVEGLATLLAETDAAVAFLHGCAELGPRALGHRSIIGSARNVRMRDRLNAIKLRESYRPVAPICLEERAAEVFTPGSPDPYMLFEQWVHDSWVSKIPAAVHLDGSARLQTINSFQCPTAHQLLSAYNEITKIPVLLNTSANLKGRGFFPDAMSAMQWGGVDFVWYDGWLASKARVGQGVGLPSVRSS